MLFQIRALIWNKLSSVEHKTLRLTCGLMKFDVENILGVSVILQKPRTTAEWLDHYNSGESLEYWTGRGIIQNFKLESSYET